MDWIECDVPFHRHSIRCIGILCNEYVILFTWLLLLLPGGETTKPADNIMSFHNCQRVNRIVIGTKLHSYVSITIDMLGANAMSKKGTTHLNGHISVGPS